MDCPDTGSTKKVSFITTEYCPNGELFSYLAGQEDGLPSSICKYYFRQLIQAVHYMHTQGVAHRDLKLENVLLNKEFDLKIIDLGFACPLEGSDGSGFDKEICGT